MSDLHQKFMTNKRKHYTTSPKVIMSRLKALKEKHAARVLELSCCAINIMKELSEIEADMDLEAATEIHNDYIDYSPDFKLTFEAVYAKNAIKADFMSLTIKDCLNILLAINRDAKATVQDASYATVEDHNDFRVRCTSCFI